MQSVRNGKIFLAIELPTSGERVRKTRMQKPTLTLQGYTPGANSGLNTSSIWDNSLIRDYRMRHFVLVKIHASSTWRA